MKLTCRIAEIRFKQNRMTQGQLSEKTDIAVSMISAYENNKRLPNAYTLWKIAKALNCRVDSLYRVLK